MRLRCARLPARPQDLLRRGVVHGAAEGIAKRKFAWNVFFYLPPRGKLPAEVSYTFIAVAYWIILTYFLLLFCDVIPFSHHFISMGWYIH